MFKIIFNVKVSGRFGYDIEFYVRHHYRISIWALIEVMTLGNLEKFILFYCEKKYFGYQSLETASQILKYVTNVRNASAHSRPLIYNVVEPFQYGKRTDPLKNKKPKIQLTQFAKSAGVNFDLRNKALTNKKANDIVATLYLHDKYVKTKKLKSRAATELKELIDRIKTNGNLYERNPELTEIFHFFEKIVLE